MSYSRLIHKQAGLTLIELLIALGIGIFLLAGIVQVFIGSRTSYAVIEAQSTMQESARFGMDFISKTVQHAGYSNEGDIDTDENIQKFVQLLDALDDPNLLANTNKWLAADGFDTGAVVAGANNGNGANAKPGTDSVTFRLQGDIDNTMLDCEGRPLTVDPALVNRVEYYVDVNDQLVCQVFDGAALQPPVALVDGVENMQILYGVATDPNASNLVSRYVNADDVDAAGDWPRVIALRVALMAVSNDPVLDRNAVPDYVMLDEAIVDPADGRARNVFNQTMAIRNRLLASAPAPIN